jgi:methionyl-tRNA formyltransferase
MRIVLISSAPPPAIGLSQILTSMGHELPALIAFRGSEGRYGRGLPFALHEAAPEADLLFARTGKHLAGLLRAYEPDVALCAAFPVKIPDEALATPRLGIVNGHPALLPRYRGPNPFGWALRNGDTALGFTFHRLDGQRVRLLRTQLNGDRGGQRVDTGDGPLWIVQSELV